MYFNDGLAFLAALLLTVTAAGTAPADMGSMGMTGASNGALEIEHAGDIAYLSGGVGEKEREEILGLGRDFDLKLVLTDRDGSYVSGVDIVIADDGGDVVLDTKTDGPLLFAKLPRGSYTVRAADGPS
jgi:hypothetical protein